MSTSTSTSIDVVDIAIDINTPYTTPLLAHDAVLKRTSKLLSTMHAVLPYLPAPAFSSLERLLSSVQKHHDAVRAQLAEVVKMVETVVRDEHGRPNRVLKGGQARAIVEEEMAALGEGMVALGLQAAKLEGWRRGVLREWGVENKCVD